MMIKSRMKNGLLLVLGFAVVVLIADRRPETPRSKSYTAPDIPEIDTSLIDPLLVDYEPFEDEPQAGDGHIVIDLSHANNLEINDLSPLRDRLEARNVTIETFEGIDVPLSNQLHRATALLVIAPTEKFTAEEQEAIANFVADGGRLLLAADPTRPVPEEENGDEFPSLYSAFFPTSAVPAINSLARNFGVIYFDDYVYNLEDNAGNYRHVKFTSFDDEHPLTQDIDTAIFFAAHSLRSDGLSLVVGDADTHSPMRTGETDLAVVTLTNDERVLALGDVTFLTAPYHTMGDNDRFLSHIADWLAIDGRARDNVDDFPYIFERPVDLVQASDDFLDPQLIAQGSELQAFFEQAGLTLNFRAAAEPDHDALLVATFDDLERVQDYLVTAGVTITVDTDEKEETKEIIVTDVYTGETEIEEPIEEKEPESKSIPGTITIETMGTIGVQGTTLFIIDRSDEHVAVVVLAQDSEAIASAVERLSTNDLLGCIQAEAVTVCSTGEAQDGLETDAEPDDTKEPANGEASGGRVFVLADNDKLNGARTSAAEFEAILSEFYDVTVWFVSQDGVPTDDDLVGYEVYIIDSGDYEFDLENIDAFSAVENIESGGVMLIGAQSMPLFSIDFQPIDDLQIADASHPLAAGFAADDVFPLLASESGIPAMVIDDAVAEEFQVVLARGPNSAESGTPSLITAVDEAEDVSHIIIAAFAFYRLPEEVQRTLALNAIEWLMEASR
ncbi:MAG: hypothetical protein GY832_47505 [Chloroflexi bacterium]|nr:hypothetical protein [Chloroflexota bacterium]